MNLFSKPKTSYEILKHAATSLIDDNLKFLQTKEAVEYNKNTPPLLFAYEFRTIKICGRRRIGHSSLIVDIIHSSEYTAVSVYPKRQMVEQQTRKFGNHIEAKIKPGAVFCVHQFNEDFSKGQKADLDLCLVDNAFAFTEEEIHLVYKTLSPFVKLFVFFQ